MQIFLLKICVTAINNNRINEDFYVKKYQLRSYNIRLVIALLITSGFGIIVINSANSAYTIRQCIGLAISLF